MDKSERHIVIGQGVRESKRVAAKAMRQHPTPEENLLWQHLRRNALNGLHFRRQQITDGFIVDFYCHEHALIVEVDGAGHHADADEERDAILRGRGLHTLRFSNQQVLAHLESVLEAIVRATKP